MADFAKKIERINALMDKKALLDLLPTALQKNVIVAYNMLFTPDYKQHKKIAGYLKNEDNVWWKKLSGWSYTYQNGDYPNEIAYLRKHLLPHVDKDSICADIACSDGYFAHF